MPIARVQTPDGRIARIEVPDGATDEQVLQFATSQFGQPEAAAPKPEAAPRVTGEILEPTTKALLRGTAQATVGLPGAFIESAGLERLYGGKYQPDYRQKAVDVLRSEQLAIGLGPNEIQAPSESEIAQEAERQKVMDTFWTEVGKRLDKAAPRDAIIKDTLATVAVQLGRKMQDVSQAATTSELLRDPYRETTPIGQRLREKPVQTVLTEGLEQLPNFAVSAGVGSATRGALGAGKLATFGGAGAASYVLEKGDIFNEGAEILAKQYGGRDSVPPEAWDKLNYFAANHGAFNAMLDAIAPSSQVNRAVLAKAGIERVMSKAGLKYVGKEFLKDFLLKELPQELAQEVSTIKAVEQATGRKLSDDEVLARLTQVGVGTLIPVGAGSVSASVANVRNAQPPAAAGVQEAPPTAPPPQAGPETPAPPAAAPSVSGVSGAPRRVWTANGTSVDTNLMVVDADQLTTSHDEAGNINPAFPADLQPRDRSRTASQAQIAGMAQALNPELLGDTGQSSSGAPIIGPDGAVESGNARTLAIRQAYDAGRGDNYRQWLTQNAGRFGIDPDQIAGIGKPVLVRMRTTPLDPAGRVAFTQESNQADIAPMAPAELAKTDSARITNQDLAQFAPSEDGNVLAASNEPFLRQFAKRIGGLEAGGFTTADGRWTKQMADRVQAAIFARAYADERLTALQSEEADPEIRNIVAGLTRAAPAFARARAVDPALGNLNITDHLVRAADLIRQARGEGRAVEEVLAQQGLFGDIPPETAALARFMEANKRSPQRMGEAFKMLGERIEDTLRGRQNANLFGPDETSLQDILTMVGARMTEQYGEGVVQGDLLAQEPADDYRQESMRGEALEGQPLFEPTPGDQTNTPEFKKWFGDSKVVDENGKPLVVYHGTKSDIQEFLLSRGGEYGSGIYFTNDAGMARSYAERATGDGAPNIVPVYVSIKKPYIANDRDEVRALGVKKLKKIGYDGIIATGSTGEKQYIAFDPVQIKSAVGNLGTFDPNDPNILNEPTPTDQIPITGTSTVALDTQRQAKGEGQDQLDLFTAPGERPVSNQQLRRIANETPKVGLVQAGTFRTALTQINTPSEAAHVVASIRKEAQENIIAVATDADGNIVGILRHGIGGPASVGSYPAILLGALHSMPKASKVWFAHNHPSGQTFQSTADRALTDAMGKAMQDTGLEMMGMLVVGPNQKSASLYHPNVDDLGEQRTIPIQPGRRTQALPVTERKFVKVRQGDRDSIRNEAVAKTQITEIMGEDSGILLTDTQLRPLGYVPMSVTDMQKLRTGESATGAGALLRAMHEANATGAFVRIKESGPVGLITPELKQAALNMKGFFAANSAVTLHDTFIGDQRTDLTESPSTFYANPLQPVWATYQRLAQKAINAVYGKVGYYLSPLRGLPQKSVFLKRYYDLLGKVSQVQDVEHGIYKAFKAAPKADQPRVYAYLTHKDADPAMIADPGARKKAMAVKRLIDRVGERLVNDGLLSPQARDRHRGEYLPRVYLKYLLDKPAIAALGAGQRPGDMGYLKQRKDIPADVRRLILGEVTDPGYLASRAYGIPARDVAFLDFFADIARNKEWIFPYVVAEWRGKPVSVYWLKNEADRLEHQAKFMEPAARKEVENMVQEMRGISEPILDQLRKAPDDFKQVPDTDRYGTLRGLWVRREIHDLILGPQSFNPDNDTAAKIVRAATWYNRIWKTSKVVWNPPSQIRNAISNGVLLHLSGVPFHRVPHRVLQAVQEIRTNGKHWRIAKKYGVKAASFSNQEMLRIERDMLDLLSREQGKMSLSHIMNIVGIVNNAVGDVYQFSESLFKTAKIIDAMEREGMGPADAAIAAHEALFDYSLVPPLVKKLRTSPIGVPFLTFYYKAAPKLIETLVLHPERFLPYFALPYLFAEMIKDSYDVDDDDLKKLKEALPTWLREKGTAYILPVKDEHGRWQAFDYGYFMPWGMYQELYNEASYLASRGEVGSAGNVLGTLGLLGGPVPDMITAVQTNIDPFTRREISNKFDPPSKQLADTLSYMWRLNAPNWVTDIGAAGHLYRSLTGAVNPRLGPQFGEPMSTPMQAGARFFGVNLYPIDPEATRAENIRAMSFEIRNTVRRLRDQLRNPNLTPEQREEMQAQYKAEIDSRQSQLQVYMERSEVHPNLRRGAIIPDENL